MSNFITVLLLTSVSLFSFITSAEVIAKKQPDSELSILGITIGKSTLNEVKEKFKSKGIYHEGEAGSSLYVLCYKMSNGSTVSFESGEMGSDAHIVNSISINGPKVPYRLNKVCEKTSLIKTKLAINGVSLGMSPELIKRLKGKPSKQTANSLLYQFEVQDKTDKGKLDIVSRLEIQFSQDAASALTASKIESYNPAQNQIP